MMYSLKVLLEADSIDLNDKNVASGLENDEPLTEPQILKIKKLIAAKLNSLSDSNLDKELGKLSLNNLKSLSRIPVIGKYYIDPAQTNSGQGKGTSAYDVSKYKSMQIVPFFVYGKDGENYNAENSRESYNLIFLVPAIGVDISEDNMEKHKKYFSKQKGFKIKNRYDKILPEQIADIRVTNEELGKVTTSFKTGNPSSVPAINSKKASRRSSPQTESLELVRNKENIVDNYNIIKTYNSNSHRKNNNMNDIFSGKLSSYLFEDSQGESFVNKKDLITETNNWRDADTLANLIKTKLASDNFDPDNVITSIKDHNYYNKEDAHILVKGVLGKILDEDNISEKPSIYKHYFDKQGQGVKLKNERMNLVIKAFNNLVEGADTDTAGSDSSEGASDLPEEVREFIGDAVLFDRSENYYRLSKDKFLARVESLSGAPTNIKTVNDDDLKGIELVYDNQSLFLLDFGAVFYKKTNDSSYNVLCNDDSIVKDTIQKLAEMYISNNAFIEEFKKDIISDYSEDSIEYKAFKEKVEELRPESAESVQDNDNDEAPNEDNNSVSGAEETDDLPQEVREFIGDAKKIENLENLENEFVVNNNVFQKKLEEIQGEGAISTANVDNDNTRLSIKYKVHDKILWLNLVSKGDFTSHFAIPADEDTTYFVHTTDNTNRIDLIQKIIDLNQENNKFLEWFGEHLEIVFGDKSSEHKAFEEKVTELRPDSRKENLTGDEVDELLNSMSDASDSDGTSELDNGLNDINAARKEESKPKVSSDIAAHQVKAAIQQSSDALSNDSGKKDHKTNIEGVFKAKILDLYNKKISIDNSDEIIKVLKTKGDDKLSVILDIISGNNTSAKSSSDAQNAEESSSEKKNESFVYKSLGLNLLLESDDDDTPKKLEKIDINVIFSNIQKTLYNDTILDKQAADIKDLLDKNTKTSNMGEIFKAASKFLGMTRARFDDIWSSSPSGPDYKLDLSKTIAYGICESVLEDKESFTEKGFEVVGTLKNLDDIRLGGGNILYSDRTYSRLAQEMKKAGGEGNKFEELSREELNKALDESVKKVILDIAIAQHMRYDEDLKAVVKPKLEKWRKSDEMSQSSYEKIKSGFTRKKAGRIGLGLGLAAIIASPVALAGLAGAGTIAAAGAIGYGFGKDSDEESFTSRKDIWAKETEVKQSADKLFEVVTSLAADIKDIYLESKTSYIKGSLTGLLFENLLLEADAKELTYEDVRKTLKANDILAFGFPDVENRKEAEVSLVESVGGMLEDTFDIKIKGIKNGAAALAMERLTSSVDKDAEKGKAAVEEISEMTAGAGVPPSMKDAMSPEQFMMMMNMSGGPMMMMFMQMMMQQQFQQQMAQMFEQMQKGKVSGSEAAETVENASAGKLSTVEKALEEALKSYNATKPALNVEDARKILLTLKENKTLINNQVKDLIKKINDAKTEDDKIEEFTLKNINAKSILKDLKDHVKIVKDEKTDNKVFDLLNINIFSDSNDYATPLTTTLIILIIKEGNASETRAKINKLSLFEKNGGLVYSLISNLSKSIKIRVEESHFKNDLFVDRLTERLFESDNSRNKFLSKNKPIKNASYNSEYLQAEMKRIWKI